MSVIVKGMEMPDDCNICKFFNDNYDYPTCSVTDHSRGYNWNPRGQRMPDCPLVEVPKHGRLIDADKLLHDGDNDKGCIDEWINSPGLPDGVKIGIGAVRNLVCYAPTIIEAEK